MSSKAIDHSGILDSTSPSETEGPIIGWDEIDEPIDEEFRDAVEAARTQPEIGSQMRRQAQGRLPGARPRREYSRGSDPVNTLSIRNEGELPGAFFFLTLFPKTGGAVRVVAYDPWVKDGDTAVSIKKAFHFKLPYYEYFDKNASGPWVRSSNCYLGEFGGRNDSKAERANRGKGCLEWDFPGSPIAKGITIAFWNSNEGSGIFTNTPDTSFAKNATTKLMPLHKASGGNFVERGSTLGIELAAAQVDFYAMLRGDLDI